MKIKAWLAALMLAFVLGAVVTPTAWAEDDNETSQEDSQDPDTSETPETPDKDEGEEDDDDEEGEGDDDGDGEEDNPGTNPGPTPTPTPSTPSGSVGGGLNSDNSGYGSSTDDGRTQGGQSNQSTSGSTSNRPATSTNTASNNNTTAPSNESANAEPEIVIDETADEIVSASPSDVDVPNTGETEGSAGVNILAIGLVGIAVLTIAVAGMILWFFNRAAKRGEEEAE